ncbi:type IV conjugative transfer system protein TraL [Budviciaceae bacterium BWR-B9]|uniref:Type IV conjugative transfer system protein TraL n=1 Tax=Limnobaculum allomyrinae TaxID=2791986 RepID=A0ABS1IUX3_9GAMM|nr:MULTISPECIES: type IV conjugative transfer system protein TraL [Limnobaculum]MBK5145552.1 type IV conjugative transfer system protein TraL [Limnobaculum allomyrinae]MBV7693670.1 type IV conjugative transfer system protein TraL [Limnobaculum sp. M2-1]
MSGNDNQRDDFYPYRFPKTLTDQERWFGLPLEEIIPVVSVAGWGLWINKPIFGFVMAFVLWLLIRKVKKGKGSMWLYNLMYWYLPTLIFKSVYKHIPDSCLRQWTK